MENNNELVIKHIELLQSIISRMAQNSFKIKGWCITLVSAILGLFISNSLQETKYYVVLLVPIIGFMILDVFYLRLERIFRNRYKDDVEKIKKNKISEIDLFDFSFEKKSIVWRKVVFSSCIMLTYLPLVIIVLCIIKCICK